MAPRLVMFPRSQESDVPVSWAYTGSVRVSECWFCAAAPASPGDHLHIALNKDMRETFFVVGIYRRWRQTSVFVPRCRRCRVGHSIARGVDYILIGSAGITGLMLLAWGSSRAAGEHWDDEWQLALPVLWTLCWLLVWWGTRRRWFGSLWLAPQPERYANEYPVVQELAADGWK